MSSSKPSRPKRGKAAPMADFTKVIAEARTKVARAKTAAFMARLEAIDTILEDAEPYVAAAFSNSAKDRATATSASASAGSPGLGGRRTASWFVGGAAFWSQERRYHMLIAIVYILCQLLVRCYQHV